MHIQVADAREGSLDCEIMSSSYVNTVSCTLAVQRDEGGQRLTSRRSEERLTRAGDPNLADNPCASGREKSVGEGRRERRAIGRVYGATRQVTSH